MQGLGIASRNDDCRTVIGYANRVASVVGKTLVTDVARARLHLQDALNQIKDSCHACHKSGGKVIFLGNGGSSAIASHMAIDFTKNGRIRAVSLNDFPTLTCISNDFGYTAVFAKQIEYYARPGDIVVCISTGGKSQNIREAARTARELGCIVYTLTGMHDDNPLRSMGDRNFYVPSYDYGIVEIAHLTLLHSLCPCTI